MHDLTEEELGFWLARFVNEARNVKGDYPQIRCISYCVDNRPDGTYRAVHIIDKSNSHFSLFWNNCDSFMKMLNGQFVEQDDVITDCDEKALWSTETINLTISIFTTSKLSHCAHG